MIGFEKPFRKLNFYQVKLASCKLYLKGFIKLMMESKVRFLPFHAINEYMLDDYRQLVIQSVLGNFSKLSEERQRRINSLIKKHVKVQGFRNSSLAPLPMKVNGCIDTYKKSPEFVSQVLSAWTEIHKSMAEIVFAFLEGKSWKLLPFDTDRSILPGFMLEWPKEETFEVLIQAFRDANPDLTISDDDISLLMVWLSNRLPYEYVDGLFKDE